MSTVTVRFPEQLEATLADRVKISGANSVEEYLIGLVEEDVAAGELDSVLSSRMSGPFEPLEEDWKERVRGTAAKSPSIVQASVTEWPHFLARQKAVFGEELLADSQAALDEVRAERF